MAKISSSLHLQQFTATRPLFQLQKNVQIAAKEYDLLVLLMEKKGEVVTREDILKLVWDYEKELESRTLDVHIRLLRQKINNQKLIETVRGVGYRISF
ncbi:MAG: winged helix-turn-helix transcriptional regulator [Treponema sp.]|nr:winged helix-turn-helix transcriptional regulator [Candidatus Treponema scatequi]